MYSTAGVGKRYRLRVEQYRVVRLLHIIAHSVEGSATVALERANILEDIERRVDTL